MVPSRPDRLGVLGGGGGVPIGRWRAAYSQPPRAGRRRGGAGGAGDPADPPRSRNGVRPVGQYLTAAGAWTPVPLHPAAHAPAISCASGTAGHPRHDATPADGCRRQRTAASDPTTTTVRHILHSFKWLAGASICPAIIVACSGAHAAAEAPDETSSDEAAMARWEAKADLTAIDECDDGDDGGCRVSDLAEHVHDGAVTNYLLDSASGISRETMPQSEAYAVRLLVEDAAHERRVALPEWCLRAEFQRAADQRKWEALLSGRSSDAYQRAPDCLQRTGNVSVARQAKPKLQEDRLGILYLKRVLPHPLSNVMSVAWLDSRPASAWTTLTSTARPLRFGTPLTEPCRDHGRAGSVWWSGYATTSGRPSIARTHGMSGCAGRASRRNRPRLIREPARPSRVSRISSGFMMIDRPSRERRRSHGNHQTRFTISALLRGTQAVTQSYPSEKTEEFSHVPIAPEVVVQSVSCKQRSRNVPSTWLCNGLRAQQACHPHHRPGRGGGVPRLFRRIRASIHNN